LGKGYIVANIGLESGEVPYTCYFASQKMIEEHPERIEAFLRAIYRAQQWIETASDEDAAKAMQPYFPDASLESLMAAKEEELVALEDVGAIVARSIIEFFEDEENRAFVRALLDAGVAPQMHKEEAAGDLFAGMTFVLTGTLPTLTRAQAEELIRANGGKAASSVSKKTSVVLAGESAGSKLEKAKTLGVRIMDANEFLAAIEKGEI